MAQPFDAKRLALAGNPVPVAERVGSFRDGGFFSTSVQRRSGLPHRQHRFPARLVRSAGRVESAACRNRPRFAAPLCPLMVHARSCRAPNPQDGSKADLWLFDLSRRGGATRLTFGAGLVEFPVWSPRREAHRVHGQQQRLVSETGKRRGRREGGRAFNQRRSHQGDWIGRLTDDSFCTPSAKSPQRYSTSGCFPQTVASRSPFAPIEIHRARRPVLAGRTLGGVRLGSIRRDGSVRPRILAGFQRRLRQHRRQCPGVAWRRHRAALAWRRQGVVLSGAGREDDGGRGDRRP